MKFRLKCLWSISTKMFFISMALFKAQKSQLGKVLQSAQSALTTLVDFCRTALTARLYILNRSFNTFSMVKSNSAEL